jgi:hypothetical protein
MKGALEGRLGLEQCVAESTSLCGTDGSYPSFDDLNRLDRATCPNAEEVDDWIIPTRVHSEECDPGWTLLLSDLPIGDGAACLRSSFRRATSPYCCPGTSGHTPLSLLHGVTSGRTFFLACAFFDVMGRHQKERCCTIIASRISSNSAVILQVTDGWVMAHDKRFANGFFWFAEGFFCTPPLHSATPLVQFGGLVRHVACSGRK